MPFTIPVGKAQSPETAFEIPVTGTTEDVLRSGAAGLRRGLEAIPGLPGDISGLGRLGVSKLAGWMGADPETQKAITDYNIPYVPDVSSETIHEATTPFIGESYEPQTTAGQYARSAGEFLPAFASNPLKGTLQLGGRLALGAVTGLASEAAGQATEGTAAEPWARAGTALLAGGGGLAATHGIEAAATAPRRAAEVAAEDAARVHGVELTKGARSGDVTQQAKEQEMLHGSRGEAAQRRMQAREAGNLSALNNAMDTISDRVAPTRGSDPVQAGDILNQSLRERVAGRRAQGGQQISDALNSGVMVNADRLRALPGELRRNLAGPVPYVPDVVLGVDTPVAQEAMRRIGQFASQARSPAVREVSLAGGEHLRQQIIKLQAAPGTSDARALRAIQDHFDDWLEQSVGAADQGALTRLQQGRATYREGARIDRPRKNERAEQPGAKTVSNMVLSGHAEDTKRLFTPTARGTLTGQAIDAIDRLVATGATRGDLDQIRGIVLDQLRAGFPQARSNKIATFIRENPTAANALFTPQELESLRSWGDTNRRLVPDPRATNPSKSSYPIVRELGKQATRQATSGGAMAGGILAGWPGAIFGASIGKGTELVRELGNRMAAGEALSPADRRTLARIIAESGGKGARRAVPGLNAREEK